MSVAAYCSAMSPCPSGESLDPPPAVIIQLMERIVSEQWPSGSEHFASYFARLGCALGPPLEPDEVISLGLTRGQFVMPGAAVNASWSALNGELFHLNLFAYAGEPDSSPDDVNAGYDAIRAGIADAFDPSPDERTDQRGNRSAVWFIQGTVIELYAHITEAPVLQTGVSHEGRTAKFHQLIARSPEHPMQ